MAKRQSGKVLSVPERKNNFSEVKAALLPHQAMIESARCLFCNEAPCGSKCPAEVDVVNFIRKIKTRNFAGAIKLIREKNPFAGSCARICPQSKLCESGCNSSNVGTPIAIGELQRFVSDNEKIISHNKKELTGKKAFIIGAGPAGLTAAYYLRREGIKVTIADKSNIPGGGLSLYIPQYRLPKSIVQKEIAAILAMGEIELKLNTEIKTGTLKVIASEYDAVIISTGLMKDRETKIPGIEKTGVFYAETLLSEIIKEEELKSEKLKDEFRGKTVSVIGGGNAAMDIAGSLNRLGAKVSVIYRRTENEMPCLKEEFTEAQEDGINFVFLTLPVEIGGREKVDTLKCRMMKLGEPDSSGRKSPVEIPGSDFGINTDYVIFALGRIPDYSIFNSLTGEGNKRPELDENTGNITGTNIYVAGDLFNTAGTVVNAIGSVKKICLAISGSRGTN